MHAGFLYSNQFLPREATELAKQKSNAGSPALQSSMKPRSRLSPVHSSILILGTNRLTKKLASNLLASGISSQTVTDSAQMSLAISDDTRAIFIVPPVSGLSVAKYSKRLAKKYKHVPVFVAFHGKLPSKDVYALYANGVQAVFEWPVDQQPLIRTAYRLTRDKERQRLTKTVGSDIALEEIVNAHLRTSPTDFGKSLSAYAEHGFVVLRGRVNALWKLYVAERTALRIPGVQDVFTHHVTIPPSAQNSSAIKSAVQKMLKLASDVDARTLALTVDEGRVRIAGTAKDRSELQRVIELIGHVRGVRSIDNFVTVSSRAKARDANMVETIREALAVHFPETKIESHFFGKVAVLSGKVSTASRRLAIEELVLNQRGVHRVVNKLRIQTRRL